MSSIQSYAGMNYDPASGGRVGPGASLNPGATAMEGARNAFLSEQELDILPEAVDAGIRSVIDTYASKESGDLKQIEPLPPPPPRQAALPEAGDTQTAVATSDAPMPRQRPSAAMPETPDGAMPEDRSERARVEDMPNYNDAEAFATKSGASVEEMGALLRTIDPEGRLPENQRLIKGLTNMYSFLSQKGDKKGAGRAAAQIIMAAEDMSTTLAARAVDLARSGDLKGAAETVKRSHNMIPDGRDFEYEVDESGNGRYVLRDRRGKIISEGPFSAKDIVGAAVGLATPDGFWKQLRTMAAEAGYGGMQPDVTSEGKTSRRGGRAAVPDDGEFRTNRLTGDETGAPAPKYESVEDQMMAMPEASRGAIDTPGEYMAERAGTMNRTGLRSEAASQADAMRMDNEGLQIAAVEIDQNLQQAIKAGAASNGEGLGLVYTPSPDGKAPGSITLEDGTDITAMIDEELAMGRTKQTAEGETVSAGEAPVQLSPDQREKFVMTLDKISRYNKVDPVTLVRPLLGVMFGDGTISASNGRVILNEDTDPVEVFMDGGTFAELFAMNRAVIEGRQRSQAGDVSRMYASTVPVPGQPTSENEYLGAGRRMMVDDRMGRARRSDMPSAVPDPYGGLNPDALSSIQRLDESVRQWATQPHWDSTAIPETDKPSDYNPGYAEMRNQIRGALSPTQDIITDRPSGGDMWVDPMRDTIEKPEGNMVMPRGAIDETTSTALEILRKLGIQP